MKKILFACLTTLFFSCSDDNNPPPELSSGKEIERVCKELGIKPKDIQNIKEITIYADSTLYKIAGGKKENESWFSKFTPAGDEIFSYCMKADGNKLPFVDYSSIVKVDGNILFLATWFEDKKQPEVNISILSLIDYSNGKEIGRFPLLSHTSSKNNIYKIYKNPECYYIMCGYRSSYIGCVGNDGKFLWGRESTESEKENGMLAYGNQWQCLDNELLLFFSSKVVGNFSEKILKIINLKEYSLELEILSNDMPFVGDRVAEKEITYEFLRAEKKADIVNVYFGEYSTKTIIDDEITGSSHVEIKLEDEYYYSISLLSGEILGKYRT